MNYLVKVTPILGPIPDALYPAMNAGYVAKLIGILPENSKL